MNWIRVEFSQRMYEPTRNQFDFDNEEMQALYRILDFCQENNVDVFLTQMSITAYSTFKLQHADPGIMADAAPFNTPN